MSWQERAACVDKPTELFFPTKGQSSKKAKAICKGCPVTQQCLTFTLAYETDDASRYGVYGGLTATERQEQFGSVPQYEMHAMFSGSPSGYDDLPDSLQHEVAA